MPAKKPARKSEPATPAPRAPAADRAFEKAREHFRAGDYGPALAIANQILQRDPTNPEALALASGCHSLQGRFDRALVIDQRAVDADPESAQAWMTLAWDLVNLGQTEDAEEAYRRVVELDPRRAAAWFHLACLAAKRGDMEGALSNLERAAAERVEYREEAKSQPEFAALLDDPRFLRIVSGRDDSDDPYAEWMRGKTG